MWKAVFLFAFCLLCAYATPIVSDEYQEVKDQEEVKTAADLASRELSKVFIGKFHHKLVKVENAKEQAVGGKNYKLDIVLGNTNCEKNQVDYENVKKCDLQDGTNIYKKCQVVVFRDLKGNQRLVAYGCFSTNKDNL